MEPPKPKLIVIRTTDVLLLVAFYRCMGIDFIEHRYGTGPIHFAADLIGVVFEIYPARTQEHVDSTTRLSFSVRKLQTVVDLLRSLETAVIEEPCQSEWGTLAVVKDPDGRSVERSADAPFD